MPTRSFLACPASLLAFFSLFACGTGPQNTVRTLGGTVTGLKGTGLVLQFNNSDDLTIAPGATSFQFDSRTVDGWTYSVTVLTQPTNPSQTCIVENGTGTTDGTDVTSVAVTCTTNTYTVGGSVSGLLGNGAGLVLQLNGGETLPVAVAGKFAFSAKVESGAAYAVSVVTQPLGPAQTCSVSDQSGTGTVGGADVGSVSVVCSLTPITIAGSITGLRGSGLVLDLNHQATVIVATNGGFSFDHRLASGASYTVSVATQPTNPSQTCTVENGNGTANGADVTSVAVTCTTNTYTVGGSVSGLLGNGAGLILQLNGGEKLDIAVATNKFAFAGTLESGATYAVTVAKQPANPAQTCSISGGSGTVAGVNIDFVSVDCTPNSFVVGGFVQDLAGSGLVLQLNGDETLSAQNGRFSFQTKLAAGGAYVVTIATQPNGQTCSVGNGSGISSGTDVTNIVVSCAANAYTINGSLAGLTGSGLVLQLNNQYNLALAPTDINFSFGAHAKIPSGASYSVKVQAQPTNPPETCLISNGTGRVGNANIGNISVTCFPPGTLTTLAGAVGQLGEDDGVGAAARFRCPTSIATDASGTLFIADTLNETIRSMTPDLTVLTIAGTHGEQGSLDGVGAEARFNYPNGIAADGTGTIYVADSSNNTIRKIAPDRTVTTVAGDASKSAGSSDGAGTVARFRAPAELAIDGLANIYVADSGNNTIRKIAPNGVVTTVAGEAGKTGSADLQGSEARFKNPFGVAADAHGNLFVSDLGNNTIRRISKDGIVSTIAGNAAESAGHIDAVGQAARFNKPGALAVDESGNIYVVDRGNLALRKIAPDGSVSTLAKFGYWYDPPMGIALDRRGALYVTDCATVRRVVP